MVVPAVKISPPAPLILPPKVVVAVFVIVKNPFKVPVPFKVRLLLAPPPIVEPATPTVKEGLLSVTPDEVVFNTPPFNKSALVPKAVFVLATKVPAVKVVVPL